MWLSHIGLIRGFLHHFENGIYKYRMRIYIIVPQLYYHAKLHKYLWKEKFSGASPRNPPSKGRCSLPILANLPQNWICGLGFGVRYFGFTKLNNFNLNIIPFVLPETNLLATAYVEVNYRPKDVFDDNQWQPMPTSVPINWRSSCAFLATTLLKSEIFFYFLLTRHFGYQIGRALVLSEPPPFWGLKSSITIFSTKTLVHAV